MYMGILQRAFEHPYWPQYGCVDMSLFWSLTSSMREESKGIKTNLQNARTAKKPHDIPILPQP
jgi:hypothetical protein